MTLKLAIHIDFMLIKSMCFVERHFNAIFRAVARDGRVGGVAINFADRRAWFWVWLLLSSLRRKKI